MALNAKRIAIAVVEHNDQVLIGQRVPGSPLAGCWEFPGGKVADGETYESAARRECLEETGLVIEIVGEFPAVTHQYDHGTLALRFFRCLVVGSSPRANSTGFQWVDTQRLADFEFPAANEQVVTALVNGSLHRARD